MTPRPGYARLTRGDGGAGDSEGQRGQSARSSEVPLGSRWPRQGSEVDPSRQAGGPQEEGGRVQTAFRSPRPARLPGHPGRSAASPTLLSGSEAPRVQPRGSGDSGVTQHL